MYEASGNLSWCDPRWPEMEAQQVIAGDPPKWADVEDAAAEHFSSQSRTQCYVGKKKNGRILFPTFVTVHVDSCSEMERDSFNRSSRVLTGHVYAQAWYLAMYRALDLGAYGHIGMLWQAALTVTLHGRVGLSMAEQAVLSIAQSEARKTAGRLQSDSFMSFASKALLAAGDSSQTAKMKQLNAAGVRFNGAIVSKTMMAGITIFGEKMTPESMQVLRKIEKKYGRDVLTNGYAKLTRLSGICTANATGMKEECEHLVQYVLEFLWWSLKFEFVAPKDVTQEYLDKARDGTKGAGHLALALEA
jgi:hypothetical protein